ncbi:MAG: cytochrome c [Elusimicrobia bacterium]|nr:cytochrome c [Elusimicrobiota bacterium]MDE2236802.1 cytochrome c [Elusimicrobiota bacterium]MDE2425956.1 cytochrome c [Elusimicrobiota bacterium]
MPKGFFAGVLAAVAALLLGAYCFVAMGLMPANADGRPPALEKWAARKSLRATIAREAPQGEGPLKPTEENLLAGVKIYAANCAVCHGGSDGRASNIATGLYQHAPQLARHGVEDDPAGNTYWKVRHGIRMTGMPSFGKALTEDQLWQVTLMLKHMDALPGRAKKAWLALPSQAAGRGRDTSGKA